MPQPSQQTWKDVVAQAISELGGEASLKQINAKLAGHPKTSTNPTWRNTIRRVVRQYRVFQPLELAGRRGIYRLVAEAAPPVTPASGSLPEADRHGNTQGMLLVLGRTLGYPIFAPAADCTRRTFGGVPLSELVTVRTDSEGLASLSLPEIRQVDVVWFDEDDKGLFPRFGFEVEETTRVKNGLLRLLKIPTRYQTQLCIVGPSEEERGLYESYLSRTPFRQHAERFRFHLYADIERAYDAAVGFEAARTALGFPLRGK